MKKNYIFFWYQEGFSNIIQQGLSDATLVMLKRTMYLAITLLSVKNRFQDHWSGGKHNAKVWTVN